MLTTRERQVMEFIETKCENHGIAPTLSEIAEHLGARSKSHIFGHLKSLEEKGFIKRMPGRKRAIEVVRSVRHQHALHRLKDELEDLSASLSPDQAASRTALLKAMKSLETLCKNEGPRSVQKL